MKREELARFVSACTGMKLETLLQFDKEILGDIMESFENDEIQVEGQERKQEERSPRIVLIQEGKAEIVAECEILTMADVREKTGLLSFTVSYVDTDGDEIVVQSDLEFAEAMDACQVRPDGSISFVVSEVKMEEVNEEAEQEEANEESKEKEVKEEVKEEEVNEELKEEEVNEEVEEEEVNEEVEEEEVDEEEEPEEEDEDEFPLPEFFKAKVMEVEKMMLGMGCTGLERAAMVEALLENKMEVDETLVIRLLEERLKVLTQKKEAAKKDLISFFSSPKGDCLLEKTAEKSLENSNDTLTNFVEVMREQ